MKRLLVLFLICMFLVLPVQQAKALEVDSFNFDLGYSKDSLSNRNFSLLFDLELTEQTYSFLFSSAILRNQSSDSLNFFYQTEAQINCYLYGTNGYLFANSGYTRDTTRQIEEIDTGAGLGLEFIYGRIQTGIFSKCSELSDEVFSVSSADLKIPLSENVRFDEKTNFGMNVDDKDDYVFAADTSLLVKMSKSVGLRAGMKYIYDNLPLEDCCKDSRWWYGGINISF